MNQLTAAMTGHGKTYVSHIYAERNRDDYDVQVILDYKDEYAGLVERGYLARLTAPQEIRSLTPEGWARIIEDNAGAGGIQVARGGLTDEEWREVGADVIRGLVSTDLSAYLTIDESHRLAPQRGSFPDAYETLATTWHGEHGVNWCVQRPAKLDETIIAQCQARLLGAFSSDADLDKIARYIEYNRDVHNDNITGEIAGTLPEDLRRDGQTIPLQRFTDGDGNTVGSEWVWSDGKERRRVDTSDWELSATHYGYDRKRIAHPFE